MSLFFLFLLFYFTEGSFHKATPLKEAQSALEKSSILIFPTQLWGRLRNTRILPVTKKRRESRLQGYAAREWKIPERNMPSWTTILHPNFQVCYNFFLSLDWRYLQRVVETLMKCPVKDRLHHAWLACSAPSVLSSWCMWMIAEARFLAQREPKL